MMRFSSTIGQRTTTESLMQQLREGKTLSRAEQIFLVALLSIPAVIAQLASVMMHYIDTAMLGHLGSEQAAAVGLVSTTIWMFWGIGSAGVTGFHVLAGQRIGARDATAVRAIMRHSLTVTGLWGVCLALFGVLIAQHLPYWLGATGEVAQLASSYFLIYIAAWPLVLVNFLENGMLRVSGNMKTPSLLGVLMCVLDVFFNALFIFPARTVDMCGHTFFVPGLALGVEGAAWATVLSVGLIACASLWCACVNSPHLAFVGHFGSFRPRSNELARALKIGVPVSAQRVIMSGAQIVSTMIVAPLGTIALAAHTFAITAESLCYMPGYAIREAATTLTAQTLGAAQDKVARELGSVTIAFGMVVMGLMGALMFFAAEGMIGIMTPEKPIIELGATLLKIEAFAEPMFAASIVAYGCFLGAGDTVMPSVMNLVSMWCVRLPLAFGLSQVFGLVGVWIAMCLELCLRGTLFLVRFVHGRWLLAAKKPL